MVLAWFSWRDHVLRIMITVVRDGEIMITNAAWVGMQKRGRTSWWAHLLGCLSGGVLLSHTLSGAVPSALVGLASGFGMGPGVSPPPWPP
jgi:membrane associated rhomboid family serine protease